MRCEDAIEIVRTARSQHAADARAAIDHTAECDDCRAALSALDAMRALRDEPTPIVEESAIERAIDRALTESPAQRYRRGFWSGLASGAAIAATIAAVAVGVWVSSNGSEESSAAVPEVRIALHKRSDVTVTLESPEPLTNAQVHVELRGAVELVGYDGQRELTWSTNLDRGVNQLTLPVVASDATGGQVLVEVMHGVKRRTFVLDVRAVTI